MTMLEAELRRRKEKNARYSLRAFASFLEIHPSALSRILNGKLELSVAAALQILPKLNFTPEEQERFIVSVANEKYQQTLSTMKGATDVQTLSTALRESEERFRYLFDAIDQAVELCELVRGESGEAIDVVVLRANQVWMTYTGIDISQNVGKRMSEWLPNLDRTWIDLFERVVRTHEPERQELYVGSLNRWMDVYVVSTEGDRFVVIGTDISHRKEHEAKLRASEEHLQGVANIAPDILWRSDADGSTTWYNKRWLDYTGQTFDQAIGWGWVDAIHPDDREKSAKNYHDAVLGKCKLEQEHRIRNVNGEYRWFLVRAEPVLNEKGEVAHMYGAATDIHDLYCAYEALRRKIDQEESGHDPAYPTN